MPWRTSDRRKRLPKDWPKIQRRILARDNHTCTTCGQAATHVDHVISHKQGGTDQDNNLTTLCAPCHQTKTLNEATQARWLHKNKRPQQHDPR